MLGGCPHGKFHTMLWNDAKSSCKAMQDNRLLESQRDGSGFVRFQILKCRSFEFHIAELAGAEMGVLPGIARSPRQRHRRACPQVQQGSRQGLWSSGMQNTPTGTVYPGTSLEGGRGPPAPRVPPGSSERGTLCRSRSIRPLDWRGRRAGCVPPRRGFLGAELPRVSIMRDQW